MDNESDFQAAFEITPDEEKKIETSLERFRSEADPVFERFRAGKLSESELKEDLKRLDARTSGELRAILGESRCHTYMEHIIKNATPELPK
jgi:hypothetical protein